ncbi:MAG: VTT domain-containing protein [Elusimicrobia bacterium]|jgi:membrane protein DedA with SNARE-associated domain|nr:VTT domain-containing protein [Elusimicrobiota bacterium]
MIGHVTQWILEALRTNGGWSVFVGVLIEQVIVPIPSPAIIMGAGFILIPAEASWAAAFLKASLEIVLPGVVASTIGAIGMYYLGHYGGKVFVDKFQKFLGFQWSDVEDIGRHFSRRGEEISLFFLRAVPVVPLSLISMAGGILKIPLGLFIVWSVLGTIVRCYLLSFLGWQMGGKALELAHGVDRFESLISIVIAGSVVGGILYIRRRVRKGLSDHQPKSDSK